MPNEEWVFWLGITNIALVVVVLLVALVVAYAVISEVLKKRKSSSVADLNEELSVMLKGEFTHGLTVPGLGLTMADGGERTTPLPKRPADKKHS
ncbi:MAG: hypothetical protein WBL63_23660 [Candidatus Acidiferrum sp.]